MKYTQTWRCGDPATATPANTIRLSDSYTLVSSGYDTSACSVPGPNCSLAADTCIQTTPDTPLPAGITSASVAPDGCYKRQSNYACSVTPSAQLSSCIASKSTCIDTTPSKVINGVTVTLAQAGGCWNYQDDCVSSNSIDYCLPLASTSQCHETNSTCTQTDTTLGTGCMKYQKTYRCNDPVNLPSSQQCNTYSCGWGRTCTNCYTVPSPVIQLSDSYTLVSNSYDPSPCASLSGNANCALASSACTSTTPPTSLPAGVTPSQAAPDGCYQTTNTYACLTGRADSSECDSYSTNPSCTLQSSGCTDQALGGQCTFEQRSYNCMTTPAQTGTVTDCSGQQFCQGGNCFNKGSPNDPDFARSMALMEAAREGGTYGSQTEIFSGSNSSCRIKLFGLANCCKTSGGGGGYSNNLLFNVAAQVGGETLSYGSKYMYDALYSSSAPDWMVRGMAALQGGEPTPLANWSPSISLYGLTVSTGPITGSGFLTNMGLSLGAPVQLGSFGGFTFAFDPTSFAIQIGIMILQDLLSCDQTEQILAMKRGQNLCYEVGTYCSSQIPIVKICIEHTKSYCCYNSRLARIINEQGRAQIGKGWGSAESPNCSGFSPTEFAAIDFSRMDLSEFTAEIMASISIPSVSGISQNAQGVVQKKLQNYYQSGRQ